MKRRAVFPIAIVLHLGACFAFGPPDGYECTQNSDCDGGEVCIEGECYQRCTLQMHCDPGMFCSADGVCMDQIDPPPAPRIPAPARVSALGGVAEVALTWESVPGADSYNVYWALQPEPTVGSNRVSAVTSPFVHAPLSEGVTYHYAITAEDGSSESVLSGEVSATTLVGPNKLVAPDAKTLDAFGVSVALSGDYVIIGAAGEDGSDAGAVPAAGAAYVFRRTGSNTWDTGARLVAPGVEESRWFGESVALSGDYAIVGAPNHGSGTAYVFHRTGEDIWDTGAELAAPDAQSGDGFGVSVALSGDYAIVGADLENGGDGDPLRGAGAAYVFERTGDNTWGAGKKLVASDAEASAAFGSSVALSGDYAIVGAPWMDGDGGTQSHDTGAAYVFHRTDATSWEPSAKLVAPDAQRADWFGVSVALTGDYAIVGAHGEDGGEGEPLNNNTGAAYVFHRTGSDTWDTGTKLEALDRKPNDSFGRSVALSGDLAVVGANCEMAGDRPGAGSAYLFRRTATNWWEPEAKLVAPDAQSAAEFGVSVGLIEGFAVVGSQYQDVGDGEASRFAGAAYLFPF